MLKSPTSRRPSVANIIASYHLHEKFQTLPFQRKKFERLQNISFRCMRNYFCQYRYRNLNACKFHLERHVEYSTGPTADKTNVTLARSNDFSRAGNTFPWTSASLKITLMESTYPGQRFQSPSLSTHFLLVLASKPQVDQS